MHTINIIHLGQRHWAPFGAMMTPESVEQVAESQHQVALEIQK